MKNAHDPVGDGPYRSAPLNAEKKHPRWLLWLGLSPILATGLFLLFGGGDEERERPRLSDVPGVLLEPLATFPAGQPDLPIAVPLGPLLAADQPDALTLLEPGGGATRLRRGQPVRFRFNRPMVDRAQVGDSVEGLPLDFEMVRGPGPIRGAAIWASRSTLVFTAEARTWDVSREARVRVSPELRSLDGAEVRDEREHVLVFDATPHLTQTSGRRVSAGEPLPLFFDNRVSGAELGRELFAYEMGGGSRNMPVIVRTRGFTDDGFRVDLVPGRNLEAGARIGVAVSPRWTPWGGGSPSIVRFAIQPPPQIEGVACTASASSVAQCSHGPRPGRVVDIGPTLRLLASEPLADDATSALRIRPALPGMEVSLDASKRILSVDGEWAPNQAYEVRLGPVQTANQEPLMTTPPLAVRSRGYNPQVTVASGRFAYEAEADPIVFFSGVNLGSSAVLYREVAPGDELLAAAAPADYAQGATAATPLLPLAPESRPNRWGNGRYRWLDEDAGRDANMAVVLFRAGEGPAERDDRVYGDALFLQRTNLGPTVRAVPGGVLVWVTTLDDAEPLAGASVAIANLDGERLAEGVTDEDGLAWIPTETDLTNERFAVRVLHEEDRAAVVVDGAVGPARLGLASSGHARPEGIPVATVLSDRGAYRPGETLRLRATARRVAGSNVSTLRDELTLRLVGPASPVPVGERRVTPTESGAVSGTFVLPRSAPLGHYEARVVWLQEVEPHVTEEGETIEREPVEHVIGRASLRVASFRQPTFRVDVRAERSVLAGQQLRATVDARYLFGAPVESGALEWSFVRGGAASYPERWSRFRFQPVDAAAGYGTIDTGEVQLSETGALEVAPSSELRASMRERLRFEAQVTDRAGQSVSASRHVTLYPAATEVGLKTGDEWIEHGEPLSVEAIVIDNEGEPVADRQVEVRFVREGWHSWWEWARGRSGGSYQSRREQRREVAHRCALTSEDAPVGCEHSPERAGTYVLEVETRDDEGRVTLASRRVYVAGPDEAPDRDPPGTPIALTPARRRLAVGDQAQIAFESPWEHAQALIAVEQEGILHVERREVGAGGQTIELEVTEAMVPNAFVSVALVRPRIGAPSEEHDVLGPDLRFGATELRVIPGAARYEVAVDAPARAEPGETVEIDVRVERDGEGAETEVLLWVVDEGTLRLTDYQVADPTAGLFPSKPARFAWDDLRRALRSRVTPPAWRAGGDGGGNPNQRSIRPDDEILEPTPLWLPHLRTDSEGRAHASFEVPARSTEYRIMALAMDDRVGWGKARASLVTTQPVVLQEALPRFVTRGDTFEAAAFVTNASEAPVDAELAIEVGGSVVETKTVSLAPGSQERVAVDVTADGARSTLPVAFVLRSPVELRSERRLDVVPRARWQRRFAYGAVEGEPGSPRNPGVTLRLPSSERGTLRLQVAAHPFVGVHGVTRAVARTPWGDVQHRSAAVMALASEAALRGSDVGAMRGQRTLAELRAEGHQAVDELLRLQAADGSFGRYSGSWGVGGWESAVATHALLLAERAGFEVPPDALHRARVWLRGVLEIGNLGSGFGVRDQDALAYGLRVLAEAGERLPERVDAVFEVRDLLQLGGMADLALAMEEDDDRRLTLVVDMAKIVDAEEDSEDYAYYAPRARVLAPVLEAMAGTDGGEAHVGPVASELLALSEASSPFAWATAVDAAFATRALAAYAAVFGAPVATPATVLLDGSEIVAASPGGVSATYELDAATLGGAEHHVELRPEDGPLFYALDAEWAETIGEAEDEARGGRVAVHRRYETASGRVLGRGDEVALGEMVRVRLFVYAEHGGPELTMLHDPLPAGFEAVDRGFQSNPRDSLMSMLGMGPDDELNDPRGFHAMRSLGSITHRDFEGNASAFYFDHLPSGLQEYTYVIRATTVGEFAVPPAQIDAAFDGGFVGRSTRFALRVVE